MNIAVDITGNRFGRLTAVSRAGSAHGKSLWEVVCDCGVKKTIPLSELRNGRTKSCGCLRREVTRRAAFKHGGSNSRLFGIWSGMRARCLNPKKAKWKIYGGRGVTICCEWSEYAPFREWAMANGYSDEKSIDRIDVNGNYEPGNCRWATPKEQSRNKRSTKYVTYQGERVPLAEACERAGMLLTLVNNRMAKGWTFERAISQPKGPTPLGYRRSHCKHGHEYTEENTAIYRGFRSCRACGRARKRDQYYADKPKRALACANPTLPTMKDRI